jgi:serine palmitoyltransferase
LVEDWTPEPLVAPTTQLEELDNEKRPIIVGYGIPRSLLKYPQSVAMLI